jgi:rare lipoprotein A
MNHRLLTCVLVTVMSAVGPALAGAEEGVASYYADSLHGNPTASGEPYDKDAMTAAHRTLAFDTLVEVTNRDNGRSAVVRINDRGPHVESRVIDVSGAAAEALGLIDSGTANVKLEVQDG